MKNKFVYPEIFSAELTLSDIMAESELASKNVALTVWKDDTGRQYELWKGFSKEKE